MIFYASVKNKFLSHSFLIINFFYLSFSAHHSTFTVDTNLSFIDIFNNMGTSTPKGFSSPDSAYIPTTPPKMFDNFQVRFFFEYMLMISFELSCDNKNLPVFLFVQFDNRIPRHLSFDCNVTTPTTPNTPSASKAYMNSSSSPYG